MNHDMRDLAYSRCKACDRKFFPKWVDEVKPCGTQVTGFEELCSKCLSIAMQIARVDHIVYGPTKGIWSQGSEQEQFITGYTEDKMGDSGDLYQEDEYLRYGEGSMGQFDYFDNYE